MRPHGLYPTRLLCSWDFPGKNTGVGYHFYRGSSPPRDRTQVSYIVGSRFTVTSINSAFNVLIHTLGFTCCPGEGNGNPLQYSCLENPRWTTVYGVAESQTGLSDFTVTFTKVFISHPIQSSSSHMAISLSRPSRQQFSLLTSKTSSIPSLMDPQSSS